MLYLLGASLEIDILPSNLICVLQVPENLKLSFQDLT